MWQTIWMYLKVFVVGGLICMAGQLLLMKTKMTTAKILVGFVTAGVILGALGVYQPLIDFAGAGGMIPLIGFGNSLAKGALEGVRERGILGAFTGGLTATAAGVAASVVFGYLFAVFFKPKMKV